MNPSDQSASQITSEASGRPVPRKLSTVLVALLDATPENEESLRKALRSHARNELYHAPEDEDWRGVSWTLQTHLREREDEEWVKNLLSIWTDREHFESRG